MDMKIQEIVSISNDGTTEANAVKIETWPVSRSVPYARHARKILQQAMDAPYAFATRAA